MKIRGHGNAVAIALAGLAVVLAASGTAYAVTAGTVKIVDAHSPSHGARVDKSGHLLVSQQPSTIDSMTNLSFGFNEVLTTETTAVLAITAITVDNPAGNKSFANTDFSFGLFKYTPGPSGNCSNSDGTYSTALATATLAPGTNFTLSYPEPVLVHPTKSKPYCLIGYLSPEDNVDPTSFEDPDATLSAYAYSGTYKGVGVSVRPGPGVLHSVHTVPTHTG